MTADILTATAADLGRRIAARELTSVEVTQAFLDQIERVDGEVNAFLHVDAEGALAQAAAVDARLDAGEELGPLAGVPVAVKDLFCTERRARPRRRRRSSRAGVRRTRRP